MLVDAFRWSLHEIDQTDIESLIPFIARYPAWKAGSADRTKKQIYADQVDWL